MNKKPWDVHAFKKAFIAVWQLNSIYFVILWPLQMCATVEFHFEKKQQSPALILVSLFFIVWIFDIFSIQKIKNVQDFSIIWALMVQK